MQRSIIIGVFIILGEFPMKRTIKLIAWVLSLILCLTVLAGCKSDEEEAPKEITFNYEIKPITDVPHTIDVVNDAVTRANTTFLHEEYPLNSETYYYCESHSVIAHTYTDDADSFDVLAHRSSAYDYQPETGNFSFYDDPAAYCLISFTKADDGYTAASYKEFGTIDAALTAADGIFGDADAVKDACKDTEYTPYRFVKDGSVYLFDRERYVTYCDNLIAEMINATAVTDSYKPIITKHKDIYNKFLDTYFALDYVIGQFLKGEADSPKAYVLYRALEDILEKTEENIDYKPEDEKKAQTYFEKVLESARELRAKEGTLISKGNFPTQCYLLHLYDESLTDEEVLAEKYIYPNPDKIIVHSASGNKEFAKGTEEYADILRANQRCYLKVADAIFFKANLLPEKILSDFYRTSIDADHKYIEYVYEDGSTQNYAFSSNSELFLIPTSEGKYNAYKTKGNSYLSDILDALYE